MPSDDWKAFAKMKAMVTKGNLEDHAAASKQAFVIGLGHCWTVVRPPRISRSLSTLAYSI